MKCTTQQSSVIVNNNLLIATNVGFLHNECAV